MPVYVGGYDPIKLVEGVMNALITKGILSKEEAQAIVDEAAAPEVRKQLEAGSARKG